jgi:hypothetical protein
MIRKIHVNALGSSSEVRELGPSASRSLLHFPSAPKSPMYFANSYISSLTLLLRPFISESFTYG